MRRFIFKRNSLGFTLIELLIVISILGVLAAGILVAIDPVDKINAANDAKVQNDVSAMGRASEAYAVVHNGIYPSFITDLVTSGELKRLPVAPSGYMAYENWQVPGGCHVTTPPSCTGIIIRGELKSKRFTSASTQIWMYDAIGKSCAVSRTDSSSGFCP